MANERHGDHREWEIDASTRTSGHPFTKYSPFRTATSTTASTLFSVPSQVISTNWVENPGVEGTDIGMFTATGSAVTRSTAQANSGTASLLTNPANSAASEGFYWNSPVIAVNRLPTHLTAQCQVRGASASGSVKIQITDASGNELATSADTNLTTSFAQITASYTIPGDTAGAAYRVYVVSAAQHNIDWYTDDIMFEVREDTIAVSDYVDGNQGIGYEWTGTANNSSSYRRMGMTTMRGLQIRNESGTSAEVVFVAFDCTATATTGIPVIAGQVFETIWPIDFRSHVSVLSASGTPTVSGVIWGLHNG
jgi:hypothetical protein